MDVVVVALMHYYITHYLLQSIFVHRYRYAHMSLHTDCQSKH